jgi:hypothetical protein
MLADKLPSPTLKDLFRLHLATKYTANRDLERLESIPAFTYRTALYTL